MLYNLENTLYDYSQKDAGFLYSKILSEIYLKSFKCSYDLIHLFLTNSIQVNNHKYLSFFSNLELEKRLERISKYLDKDWCGSWLRFGEINQEKTLLDANFCKNRICPTCLKRRSLVLLKELEQDLEKIYQLYPSANFYFLTLGIKNCSVLKLRETLNKLNQAKSILFGSAHGKSRKSGVAGIINKHLLGYKSYTEISKGFLRYEEQRIKTDELGFIFDCHPHFHILLLMDEQYTLDNYLDFIPQNSDLKQFQDYQNLGWVQLWDLVLKKAGLTQENLPTAHIQKIDKTENNKIDKKAILELAKYSIKLNDFLPNFDNFSMENHDFLTHHLTENALECHDALFLAELSYQLHEYRSVSSGGTFRNKNLTKINNNQEDLINISKKVDKRKAVNCTSFRWQNGKHCKIQYNENN